jgi:hypothetical protein
MKTAKNKEDKINKEIEELRYAWTYKGNIFQSEDIGKYVGFVYLITNLLTGKKYIGQKLFTKATSRIVNGKTKKSRGVSTWKKYYGSSIDVKFDVQKLGRDNFKREILYLCENKSLMNYLEALEIFRRGALISENYYNLWCKVTSSKKFLKLLKENP